jgi:hypothetical protein
VLAAVWLLVDADLQCPGCDDQRQGHNGSYCEAHANLPTQYVGRCGPDYRWLASVGLFNFFARVPPTGRIVKRLVAFLLQMLNELNVCLEPILLLYSLPGGPPCSRHAA